MPEKPHLLLFDDEEDTGDLVKDSLEDDFEVTWVRTKEELRDAIEPDLFSVIVTDVSIETSPEAGYEIVDKLRRVRKITRIPVIVYSGVRNMTEIEKTEDKLYHSYITKGSKGWIDTLVSTCLKASNEDRHLVSWKTFEGYFKKSGIIDSPISSDEIPENAFILGIDLGKNPTNRSVIALIKNQDIDDVTWDELEKLLWKKYLEHSRKTK